MKTSRFMATTALVAILAGPVVAQATDDTSAEQGQIGSYSVGEFLNLTVVTSEGDEAGQVLAVIEGDDGAQILVSLDDKVVALPLNAFSMEEEGQSLSVDRSMTELRDMAAFAPAGEMELDPNTRAADAMGGTDGDMPSDQTGDQTEMAEGGTSEMEELDTSVVDDTAEDVTVITTDPSSVEGEGTEMAEDGRATATQEEMQTAEDSGDMTSEGDEAVMAEGETGMTGDDDQMQTAETETGTTSEADGTLMVEGGVDDAQTDPQTTGDMQTADADTGDAGRGISAFVDMTVADLVGMEVIGSNGNDVGDIDYVVGGQNGEYQLVIGVGGFLGLGEHTVALPLSAFAMGEAANTLVLDGYTEEELDAMQEVDESTLTGLSDDHVISDT